MAPRWIKTKDHQPQPYMPNYGDHDSLLLSGEWIVERSYSTSSFTRKRTRDMKTAKPVTQDNHAGTLVEITKATLEDVVGIQNVLYRAWLATYPNKTFGISGRPQRVGAGLGRQAGQAPARRPGTGLASPETGSALLEKPYTVEQLSAALAVHFSV